MSHLRFGLLHIVQGWGRCGRLRFTVIGDISPAQVRVMFGTRANGSVCHGGEGFESRSWVRESTRVAGSVRRGSGREASDHSGPSGHGEPSQ